MTETAATRTPAPHWHALVTEVIDAGLCSGCGACVVACPRQVLAHDGNLPYQTDVQSGAGGCRFGDAGCSVCAKACVRFHPDMPALETAVVGRPRMSPETWGVAREVVAARAVDGGVRQAGQDGGMVTALLSWAFDEGLIDGAVVSGLDPERPQHPVPRLVESAGELRACARSRYTYSPNPLALLDVAPARRIAMVGTPCEISAVRRAQAAGLKRFRPVVFTVGLMCSETFTTDGLLDEVLQRQLGIDLHDVEKVNIKGRLLVSLPPGREGGLRHGTVAGTEARIVQPGLVEIPLKECKPYARESCHWCPDFSAELADVSAGGLGLDGWTFAVVRTDAGVEWMYRAVRAGHLELHDATDFPEALAVRDRCARVQRRRPQRMVADRGDESGPTGFDGTTVLSIAVPAAPPRPAPAA